MNIKRTILIIILIILISCGAIFCLFVGERYVTRNSGKLEIVTSNFASYDFLRAILGDTDDFELTFLIGPGKDSHSYDPTAQDLITIQNSDLFVYIGGDMENWSEDVLDSIDTSNTQMFCVSDYVQMMEEKDIDGVENDEDYGYEEHIWTSPDNAIVMVNTLESVVETINPSEKETYRDNAKNYIKQIQEVDNEIQDIVDNEVRDRLVFGDKMPMQYFIDYYELEVSAAYKGCSTEVDPNTKTLVYLVDKVKEEDIPVVLYVELGTGQIAETIAEEAGNGAVAMQIQTLHNVSKDDFENGETWVSLMKRNLDVLKLALW